LLEPLIRGWRGDSFIITTHDQPVARLVAYRDDRSTRRKDEVAEMRALRAKCKHKGAGGEEVGGGVDESAEVVAGKRYVVFRAPVFFEE